MKKVLNKLCIYDAEGTEVAYVNNGIIYATSSGRRIGSILGGVIHGVDGQKRGRRTPFRSIKVEWTALPLDAFMRLVKGA